MYVTVAGENSPLRPFTVSENETTLESEDRMSLVTLTRDDLTRLLAACDKENGKNRSSISTKEALP